MKSLFSSSLGSFCFDNINNHELITPYMKALFEKYRNDHSPKYFWFPPAVAGNRQKNGFMNIIIFYKLISFHDPLMNLQSKKIFWL